MVALKCPWSRKGLAMLALYAAAGCRNEPPVAAAERVEARYPSLLERMPHHLPFEFSRQVSMVYH